MPFIASTSVQMLVKTWKYCANSSVFSSQIPSDERRRSRVSSATTNRSNHVSSRCNICQTLHSRSWAEVAVLSFFFLAAFVPSVCPGDRCSQSTEDITNSLLALVPFHWLPRCIKINLFNYFNYHYSARPHSAFMSVVTWLRSPRRLTENI